ncbi:hypothetical protein ACFRAQ_34840 [Nocardia sp. NPDC056611]|uniref:hypothetical protein n=1 Tax=Nocardia sp. NPDC056611 TaxID=3345877 RepID=UPI00366DCFEB
MADVTGLPDGFTEEPRVDSVTGEPVFWFRSNGVDQFMVVRLGEDQFRPWVTVPNFPVPFVSDSPCGTKAEAVEWALKRLREEGN